MISLVGVDGKYKKRDCQVNTIWIEIALWITCELLNIQLLMLCATHIEMSEKTEKLYSPIKLMQRRYEDTKKDDDEWQ